MDITLAVCFQGSGFYRPHWRETGCRCTTPIGVCRSFMFGFKVFAIFLYQLQKDLATLFTFLLVARIYETCN
jgi:hypothetical protein